MICPMSFVPDVYNDASSVPQPQPSVSPTPESGSNSVTKHALLPRLFHAAGKPKVQAFLRPMRLLHELRGLLLSGSPD